MRTSKAINWYIARWVSAPSRLIYILVQYLWSFCPKKLKWFKFKEIHCQIRVSHAKLHIKYHCCPVVWIICWWMQQNSKIRNVLKTSFWPFWPFALKQDIDHYTRFCRSWEGLHNALLIFRCCFENFLKIGEKLIFRKIAIFQSVDYFGHSTLTDRKTRNTVV